MKEFIDDSELVAALRTLLALDAKRHGVLKLRAIQAAYVIRGPIEAKPTSERDTDSRDLKLAVAKWAKAQAESFQRSHDRLHLMDDLLQFLGDFDKTHVANGLTVWPGTLFRYMWPRYACGKPTPDRIIIIADGPSCDDEERTICCITVDFTSSQNTISRIQRAVAAYGKETSGWKTFCSNSDKCPDFDSEHYRVAWDVTD